MSQGVVEVLAQPLEPARLLPLPIGPVQSLHTSNPSIRTTWLLLVTKVSWVNLALQTILTGKLLRYLACQVQLMTGAEHSAGPGIAFAANLAISTLDFGTFHVSQLYADSK